MVRGKLRQHRGVQIVLHKAFAKEGIRGNPAFLADFIPRRIWDGDGWGGGGIAKATQMGADAAAD